MSYEKYYPGGWQSGESGGTPITPEALNHIENGIANSAPAGYGLGANGASDDYTTVNSSEADALNRSGLYVFFDDANPITNTINSGGRGLILHLQQSLYYTVAATQKFYPMYVGGYLERKKLDGSGEWQPWEWVDPPMGVGVEYRTTERWNDKAVYTKLVDCGAALATMFVPINTTFTHVIRYAGTIADLAMPVEVGESYAKCCVTSTIDVQESGYDGLNVKVQIWYTKD